MGKIDWENVERNVLELIIGLVVIILITLLFNPVDDAILWLILITAGIASVFLIFKYASHYLRKYKKLIFTIIFIFLFTLLVYLPDRDSDMWEVVKENALMNQDWVAGKVEFSYQTFDEFGNLFDTISFSVTHQIKDGELQPTMKPDGLQDTLSQRKYIKLYNNHIKPYATLGSESIFFQTKEDVKFEKIGEEDIEGRSCRKYSYIYDRSSDPQDIKKIQQGILWLEHELGIPMKKSTIYTFPENSMVLEIYEDVYYDFSESSRNWYAKIVKITILKIIDEQLIEERMNLVLSEYFKDPNITQEEMK